MLNNIKQSLENRINATSTKYSGYLGNGFEISPEKNSDKDLIRACQNSFDDRFTDQRLEEILELATNGHFYKIHIMVPDEKVAEVLRIILNNFDCIAPLINSFKYRESNLIDCVIDGENFHLPTFVFYAKPEKAQECLDLMVRLFGDFELTLKTKYNVHVKGAVFYSGGSRDHKTEMLEHKIKEDEWIRNKQRTNPSFITTNRWDDLIKRVWEDDMLHYRGQLPLKILPISNILTD